MEEKERFEWNSRFDEAIKDNQTGDIVNAVEVLNKQDTRIKELEEQEKFFFDYRDRCQLEEYQRLADKEITKLDKENAKLKQQLHELPKKIVGEIKLQLFNHFKVKNIEEYEKLPLIDSLFTADTVIEILDTILKKYGGEDE